MLKLIFNEKSYSVSTKFFAIFCSFLAVSSCLQCYNCRGITNYDPNGCFNPSPQTTYLQECGLTEVCEKRVTQVDRLQDVIDRGCSPNCVGGQFVWTDEFQVYCCNDASLCNSSPGIRAGFLCQIGLTTMSAFCIFVYKIYFS